jgi:uncharacterized membrane protein
MPGTSLKQRMERDLFFLGGLALGAHFMYMLDPERGHRRRAMARDRAAWALHKVQYTLDRSLRDLGHRVQGAAAEVISDLVPEHVDDPVLVQRVRARLGRAVSHPGAIEVSARAGVVTLKGAVLERELHELLWAVRAVRGVAAVDNQLTPHAAADIPDLQGVPRAFAPSELLRSSWKPATRMLVGTAGLGLAAYGLLYRRDAPGALLGFIGLGAMVRTAINERIIPLPGVPERPHGIELQKTVHFHVPVERVFALLADPVKFPQFLSHVHDVRPTGERRYHWTISGPLNTCLSWESEVTRLEPNKLIEWRSLPGAAIENHGTVHFATEADGATRVHIRLSYHPPTGILAHTFAELFGADPRAVLDEDMVRFKSLLEQGKTHIHHHQVTLAQVAG